MVTIFDITLFSYAVCVTFNFFLFLIFSICDIVFSGIDYNTIELLSERAEPNNVENF